MSKKAEKSCFLLLLSVNSKVKLVYRGSKCRAAGTYLNMARTDLLEMDLVLIRSGGPEMKFVDSNQTNIKDFPLKPTNGFYYAFCKNSKYLPILAKVFF